MTVRVCPSPKGGTARHRSGYSCWTAAMASALDPVAPMRWHAPYFTAQGLLTRLPCPDGPAPTPRVFGASCAWFPLVGVVVGLVTAGVAALLGGALDEPMGLAVAVALGVGALVTGSFHEDAFADVCDAFGGMTHERRREIMRDSRVGSFGAVGVAVLIVAKVAALSSMPWRVASAALLLGHVVARWSSTVMLRWVRLADTDEIAKVYAGQVTWLRLAVASLVPTVPLAWLLLGPAAAGGLLLGTVAIVAFASIFFRRWLGGITGDCIGSVNQVVEVLVFAVAANPTVADAILRRVS